MAALDFPDAPATGDLYGSSGTVWRWDGARWASTAGASGPRGRVAYAQITVSQTGITTKTDIAGLSATFTADPTRTYRTTVYFEVTTSVANDLLVGFIANAAGTQLQRYTNQMGNPVILGSSYAHFHMTVVETGLSGTETRKAQLERSNGTGTAVVGCSAVRPAFILVEDITYEAGTSGPGYPEPHKGDELTATVLEYVPAGPGDYSNVAWSGWQWLGNVTIPTWATQAAINLNIVGMIAVSAVPCNHFLRMVLGTHVGSPLGRADYYTLSQRFSTSWADLINLTSTGLQTLKIEAYTASGTVRADTSTYFTAMVIFR